ncbi:MAG: peptidylprolyl isomerase [Lactobacillales bacterium]|jgi:peptidyl-prolyl cis-trans isomerase A (cyclophilin A)|nr:peptidylprolyl isomerase [Lactobacillales bacterium]
MKRTNKFALTALTALTLFSLAACGSKENGKSEGSSSTTTTSSKDKVDINKLDLPQLSTKVAQNEDLVELETTAGNIQIKLFPKQAPLAVENFMTHAKEGYYNGTIFHRVIKDFMIQGGDPKGNGTGGESIWNGKDKKIDSGNGFKNEVSNQLYNLNGALSMANAGQDTNGSQFFINSNTEDKSDGLLIDDVPKKIIEAYKKGGNPNLDGSYTVFGQVVSGMDVVEKIASAPVKPSTSGESSTPETPVKINTIKILQEAK